MTSKEWRDEGGNIRPFGFGMKWLGHDVDEKEVSNGWIGGLFLLALHKRLAGVVC